ncbi:MAG: hypothetical protein L0219_19525 [Phycisphaerales bacterium]|nr:hypothetical protein [Phycisphaerales bacterium]
MRLLEAIVEANHHALGGDAKAGLRPTEHEASLPIVALTCIDPRLNPLIPEVLGVPEESFIWLRNAGNIITGLMSSTLRSLALACAVKGGKEIAIIGHSDCLVRKTSALQLTDRFSALGVPRTRLPDNLQDFFGLFASERQNVLRGCDFVRQSPLIGPKVPVHGLMIDIESGRLEWVVNGYQTLETAVSTAAHIEPVQGMTALGQLPEFRIAEMKFPEQKIGEQISGPIVPMEASPRREESLPEPTPAVAEKSEARTLLAGRIDPAAVLKVVGEDRKIYGPVTVRDIEQWLREGRIDLSTLVQRVGYKEWKQLAAFFKEELQSRIPIPPTLPSLKVRKEKRK